MNSIGISVCSDKAPSPVSDLSIQLHLNIWKSLPKYTWSKEISYLDMGIMSKFYNHKIRIYLPFELNDKYPCEDLAKILTEKKSILCSLFNEDYNVSQIKSGCYHLVSLSESFLERKSTKQNNFVYKCESILKSLNKCKTQKILPKNRINYRIDTPDSFYLYPLGANDINIEKCKDAEGSILSIDIPNQEELNKEDYYYIRFRVPLMTCNGLALKTDLSDNLIQSAFTRLDMYNVQINEKRDIPFGPKGILTSSDFKLATFSKIHILYLSNPRVTVENGSSTDSDSRIIEVAKWQPYLPSSYSPDTYIAHHWKFSAKNNSPLQKTNLFFSARYPKTQPATLIAYLCVVIVLGFCGSFLASLLYGYPKSEFNLHGLWSICVMLTYITGWCFFTHYKLIFEIKRKSTVKK